MTSGGSRNCNWGGGAKHVSRVIYASTHPCIVFFDYTLALSMSDHIPLGSFWEGNIWPRGSPRFAIASIMTSIDDVFLFRLMSAFVKSTRFSFAVCSVFRK